MDTIRGVRTMTNQVLFLEKKDQLQVFVPAYLRMTFKKITEINLEESSASMIATIILTLYHRGLPEELREHLKRQLILTVGEQHVILSENDNQTKMSQLPSKSTLTFTYRAVFNLQMSSEVFMVPFDVQSLTTKMCIRTINTNFKSKRCSIMFNIMDNKNEMLKFTVTELDDMGEFGMVGYMMKAIYRNQLSETNQNQSPKNQVVAKVHPFNAATFRLGIYRYPGNTLLMIFIPLWLLALINLAIFFQANSIKDRISNIATLMVAYSAFLPVIRTRIPPSPQVTLIQVITYSLLSTTVLCLVQSLILARSQHQLKFVWYSSTVYMICLGVTLLSLLGIFFLLIIHKMLWEPSYRPPPAGCLVAFRSEQWSNPQCDQYFESFNLRLAFKIE